MRKLSKKLSLLALGLSTIIMIPTTAHADELGVSVSVDYVSEYVFRGVSLARGAVQPGVEASYGNWTLGVWTSAAIGEASSLAGDEIDVYAGYAWDVNDVVSADVGATIYHYPDVDGSLFDFGDASTIEIYGGLGFDTVLAPSIYAYYDFDLEAFTLEGGLSHSYPMGPKTSFDLGLTAGLVTADGGGDYEYGSLSASVGYAFTDAASAYVGANYVVSSEDTLNFRDFGTFAATTDDNMFWFGAGVSAGF